MRWDGMGWDGMGWDGMGWDGTFLLPPGSSRCVPASQPSQSLLHAACTSRRHAPTFPWQGRSPERPPSDTGQSWGHQNRRCSEEKRRPASAALAGGIQSPGERELRRREGANPPRDEASCSSGVMPGASSRTGSGSPPRHPPRERRGGGEGPEQQQRGRGAAPTQPKPESGEPARLGVRGGAGSRADLGFSQALTQRRVKSSPNN